jgi:hypothetical protein
MVGQIVYVVAKLKAAKSEVSLPFELKKINRCTQEVAFLIGKTTAQRSVARAPG